MTAPDVFQRVVHALDAADVPYMLTGSFASAYHAVPRATQDIDPVIAPSQGQLAELARAFSTQAYYCDADAALEALEQESLFNVIDLATGWKIDFIIRKSREYSRTEFARRQHFFARSGPGTITLQPDSAKEYIRTRFVSANPSP